MSTAKSMFDHILETDENVEIWKKQLIETENSIQNMLNDLEVEQSRGTLVLNEMRGTILLVEQLTLRSSQRATERLQNLMMEQLIEINKSEILVKVNEENYKQCVSSLQEIPRWEPHMSQLTAQSQVGQEVELSTTENQQQYKIADVNEREVEEKKTIQDDISKIEEAIAESKKEHDALIEFLTEHQKLLTEIESTGLCDNEDNIGVAHSTDIPDKTEQFPIYESNLNAEADGSGLYTTSNSSIPKEKPKIHKRPFQAKSAIINKKEGAFLYTTNQLNEDFTGGCGIESPNQQSVTPASEAETILPMKKAKLNLYDAPKQNQTTLVTESKSQVPLLKPSSLTFKPKIPSSLKSRMN